MFEWVWSKMGQAALNKVRNKLFSMRYNCKKAKIYLMVSGWGRGQTFVWMFR